jgi:formate hydrogenlyase subunit 3/multisubunit Na+/H+ antiporter MnhD subunit
MVMKFYHNSFIGKVLVLFFAIAIHAYFASGAYLLGGFLGRLFLYDVPHGGDIGSYGLAILTFSGAMYAFMYLEYAREDVEAYEEQSGDGTFRRSLREIQWLIAGAELASLVYRSVQAPSIWIGWHRARNMTRQLLGGDEKNFPHAQAATQASPLSQNGNH